MDITADILAILLSVVLVGSGFAKLRRADPVVKNLNAANVPDSMYTTLALLEFAGAVGLVIGIWWAPLGVAAAIGVVGYFVGAVVFHVRAHDPNLAAPVVLGLLAVAAGLTRVLA